MSAQDYLQSWLLSITGKSTLIRAVSAATPKAVPSPVWGMSGRMAQMQLRNMMQMKAFK